VVDLTEFNGLFDHLLPFLTEISIVHVNNGFADQIVAELRVVIHYFDLQARSAWESHLELEHPVELRIGFVIKVEVSFID